MTASLLKTLRVRSTVQGRLAMRAPWGAHLTNQGHAAFYVIAEGRGWLQLDGQDAPGLVIEPGSFVFVREGQGYAIRDSPATPLAPVAELLATQASDGSVWSGGGAGALTRAVFGCFDFEPGHPLLAALPPMLHRRGPDPMIEWVDASLRLLGVHGAADGAFECRLAEALALHVFRTHFADGGEPGLALLADAHVAHALALIHDQPAEQWTVGSLAASVGLSRTVFAARFATLVGEPPLRHLTRFRLREAARLLRESDLGVGEIAGRVGYAAEAALRRAFKRWRGVGPGAFRRGASRPARGSTAL